MSTGAVGDIVTAVDGKPVRRLADLTDALEQGGVGRSVRLTVKRGSDTREVNVDIVDIDRS
jgi:2-alkenal reductase